MEESIQKMNEYIKEIFDISKKYENMEGGATDGQLIWYMDFIQSHPEIKVVLEIGFNFGLSAVSFLSARDDINVISIDLGEHKYIEESRLLINKFFPNRHKLIIGSSESILPSLRGMSPPDFILIDGNHMYPMPALDIKNSFALASIDTWICVDDVNFTCGSWGVIQAVCDIINTKQVNMQTFNAYYGVNRGLAIFKKSSY